MGKLEKLKKRLLSKPYPKDFTFDEMRHLLEYLGFVMSNKGKTSGSRVEFSCGSKVIFLHKPHPGNELPEYQIKQIIRLLEKENLI